MAYVFSTAINQSDGGSSDSTFTPTNPIHDVDDVIFHVITNDNGGTTITESVGGWTELGTQSQENGSRSAVFYKKATTSTTADPIFNGASDGWAIVSFSVRDADTTTAIDVSAQSNISSSTNIPDCPTVTTTTADCLILRCCCGWDSTGSYAYHDGTMKMLPIAYDSCSSIVSVSNQPTAGATGVFTYQHARNDGGNTYTIAVRNKSGGGIEPKFTSGISYENRAFGQFGLTGSALAPTFTTLYSSITSIAGVGVTSTALLSTDNLDLPNTFFSNNSTRARFSDGTNGVMLGVTFPHVADLSGKSIIVNIATSFTAVANLGRIFILFDSVGNWSAFNSPSSEGKSSNTAFPLIFDDTSTPIATSGTLDWTDIAKVGYAGHKRGTSTSQIGPSLATFATLGPYLFSGCNAARPITPSSMSTWLEQSGIVGVANLQGSGQLLSRTGVQIGDGTTETHFKAEAQSFELPSLYGKGQNNWAIGEGNIDITIYTSASDVIDFASSIFSTASSQNFTINPSSNTAATFDFSGCSLVGWDVTWLTGVTCNQAAFINCANISGQAATFSNCIVKSSTAATNAMTLTAGASVTSTTFTIGAETYALNLSTAGAYNLSNNVYTGYTKPLNVTAATGTVTISLAFGESQPTYDSAGATVVFSQPQSVAEVTSIIAGSRIQVYNVTAATEVANEVVVGTTWTLNYDDTVEFTAGDTVRVRLTCQSGTTSCQQFQTFAIAGVSGWSILASQEVLAAYATIGIDGSLVTEYALDAGNLQADANDADGVSQKARLVAWFYYAVTSEVGIRDFFQAIVIEDEANAYIDPAVVNLKLDNISSQQLLLDDSDFRLYTTDGSDFVLFPSTGGYGITFSSGKVYVGSGGGGTGTSDLSFVDVKRAVRQALSPKDKAVIIKKAR